MNTTTNTPCTIPQVPPDYFNYVITISVQTDLDRLSLQDSLDWLSKHIPSDVYTNWISHAPHMPHKLVDIYDKIAAIIPTAATHTLADRALLIYKVASRSIVKALYFRLYKD